MQKLFTRRQENFICENCQREVIGNGFTNHCPNCLFSKHVDINPGDRDSDCLGIMEPIKYFKKNGKEFIQHKCLKCGHLKPNQISEEDNYEEILNIVKKNYAS